MDTLYLAIIDCDESYTYVAFDTYVGATNWLNQYVIEQIEVREMVLVNPPWTDWDRLTGFNEQLSIHEIRYRRE